MAQKVTVLIGRFSPVHNGHNQLFKHALRNADRVVILVGSSGQARTIRNPFTFAEREFMIEQSLSTSDHDKVHICPLLDLPYNDSMWIESVQKKVADCVGTSNVEITLTGCDKDESTWYLRSFPQWKTDFLPEYRELSAKVNATTVRDLLFSNGEESVIASMIPTSTLEFIEQFKKTSNFATLQKEYEVNKKYRDSWALAPYPPTFVTSDAVVIQSGHVLVVERGSYPGKGLWALPGGFLNQNERFQTGAVRELMEETGISMANGKRKDELTKVILTASIQDKEIFDHPARSDRGRTITVAFLLRLDDTKPLPLVSGQNAPLEDTGGEVQVETAKAFWIPISEALAKTDQWFEDHHSILLWASSKIGSR